MAITIKNKFGKSCQSCRQFVNVDDGFAHKPDGGYWTTYCQNCLPVQKTTQNGQPIAKNGSASQENVARRITSDGRVFFAYDANLVTLVKSLPKARFVKESPNGPHWTVSTAECDRPRLLTVAEQGGFDVAPELKTVKQTEQAQTVALDERLYPFQREGVRWLSLQHKALLGDMMGLGKTVQALLSLQKDATAIVVCPATLKFNWKAEGEKWRPDLSFSVLNGKDSFREPKAGEVIITNYESLPADFQPPTRNKMAWAEYKKAKLDPFRDALRAKFTNLQNVYLISDESQKVKNWKASRSQRFTELANLCGTVWGLTGTPFDNRPEDLYGVLSSLGMAFDVFGSWNRFLSLFNATKNRWGGIDWGTPQAIVPELLRRVMLRRRREEVLPDLPTKTHTTLIVNGLDTNLRRKMDAMYEEWCGFFEASDELPPFEEFSALRAELAASRIDAMLEYVESSEEQDVPLVIASAHLAPLDELAKRPGWKVIIGEVSAEKRQEIVNEFQNGQLKGVGLSIRAAGYGLTLTHAWKMLFVDLDWTPMTNAQCEDRLVRIGQTRPVEIVHMVSDHPLDKHVLKLLSWKIEMIQKSVEETITVSPAPIPSTPTEGETEEQFQARIKAAREKVETLEREHKELQEKETKEQAKGKVAAIHNRMKERHDSTKNARELLPLTPERSEAVRKAFNFMLSVCDGAVRRDEEGFNKPDSVVAHCLLTAGLETDAELEAGYYLCSRYHRQLNKQFPILFKD